MNYNSAPMTVSTVLLLFALALSVSTVSVGAANAAILPATGTTTPGFDTNPELDGQTLVSLTRGGSTFTDLSGATSVTASGSIGTLHGAENEGAPATTNDALSGLKFTQFQSNMQQTDYTLGVTVNPGDLNFFFFGEINIPGQAGDDVTVQPLSGGSPIAGWSISIVGADYGDQSAAWDFTPEVSGVPVIHGRLTSFELSDFTGGVPGTLVNVDGIRLLDNVGGADFDPLILGVATIPVPEPSTALIGVLWLVGGAFISQHRRRRWA